MTLLPASRSVVVGALILAVLTTGFSVWKWASLSSSRPTGLGNPTQEARPPVLLGGETAAFILPAGPAGEGFIAQAYAALQGTGASSTNLDRRKILQNLRAQLRAMPRDLAAHAVAAFLETGQDWVTGLGFTIGSGGTLEDAPTLRVALLDLLGQFDPEKAIALARKIFASPKNPEEYALGLRALGWQNAEGEYSGELRQHFLSLLDRSEWLQNPSLGFLQAFDVSVHLGGREEIAALASVMKLTDANGAPTALGATHAAFLALDRITQAAPRQTLELLADATLLNWAPAHRGALLARADVSEPEQRARLELCLASLAQAPEAAASFANLFPHRDLDVTPSLITGLDPVPGHDALAASDTAALKAVNEWLTAKTFPELESHLRRISERLSLLLEE